jgi:hypothetical protein
VIICQKYPYARQAPHLVAGPKDPAASSS